MQHKGELEMGRITNTHGIRGEVKAQSWGDFEDDLLEYDHFYVGAERRLLEVERARMHKNLVIFKFKGIDTMNDAEKLKNSILYLPRQEVGQLEQDTYFLVDLVGLEAFLEDGRLLGRVKEVLQNAGNDVLVIAGTRGQEHLVPFIQQFVRDVDIEAGRCVITPIEGLLDDEI
ncbi:MAG: ribosome maturation factor RimM [Eubacteriales bacterium]|jgi:16S rRNA processing protein RimM